MKSNIISEIESRYRSNPLHGVTFSIEANAYDCTEDVQFGESETANGGGYVENFQDIIYNGKVIGWVHEYRSGRIFDPTCVQFCYPLADCTEQDKCARLEKQFANDPRFYDGETYRLNFATLQQLINYVKANEESTTDTNQESTTDTNQESTTDTNQEGTVIVYKITCTPANGQSWTTYKDTRKEAREFVANYNKKHGQAVCSRARVELVEHHTATARGYISKGYDHRESYAGKFGTGFIMHHANADRPAPHGSNNYHVITYFIEK